MRWGEESPSHGFAVPAPFRQGTEGTGEADCHDQFANWSRNDRALQEVRCAGRCGERTGRCQWQKQRSERVAAVKISSVRRKAAQKFWAPQQDHRPLRMRCRKCGEVGDRKGRPYGKRFPLSGEPLGGTDCHSQCAHWLRNDSFFARSAVVGGRRDTWVPPCGG